MKYILLFLFISCSIPKIKQSFYQEGDLLGAFPGISYESTTPEGSVFISSGSFLYGSTGGDLYSMIDVVNLKTVSITALFVDETEITNAKYRKFYTVVQEDIVRKDLADEVEVLLSSGVIQEEGEGIFKYSYIYKDTSLYYYKYLYNTYNEKEIENIIREIDYTIPLYMKFEDYPDKYYAEIMDQYFLYNEREERIFDKEKVIYNYSYFDYTNIDKNSKKKDYVITKSIKLYPDMDVWSNDFAYSYNEPISENYFEHYSFDDYPVVGVNWFQAKAFCSWRTQYKNRFNSINGYLNVSDFRLPSEVEWEYIARGDIHGGVYPWGGGYLVDEKGGYLANFKPLRGNYAEDGYLYTSQVRMFKPNSYGLYDISGNVSEWTNTSYREDDIVFYTPITPDYAVNNERGSLVVVRGGSWKDFGYMLRVSVRDFEFKEKSNSYTGFRTIQEYQGERIGKVELELYLDY